MRFARRAARTRYGPTRRDGQFVRYAPPSMEDWLSLWSLSGPEGGMEVVETSWEVWRGFREDTADYYGNVDSEEIMELVQTDVETMRR